MKIVLSGGTGFIGKAMVERLLVSGHEIFLLSRSFFSVKNPHLKILVWDGKTLGPWADSVSGADAVINLAGESIAAKRWTRKRKEVILGSRLDATRALLEAIRRASPKPPVLVNASAVGFYGPVPEGNVTEEFSSGSDFLAQTCGQWEKEAKPAESLGVRVVVARFGVVLDRGGGALEKMLPPFQLFIGGPLGSGKQWVPWIHREDAAEILNFMIENKKISGPVNVTAPEPVRMEGFCRILGRVLGKPCWAPVPSFALQLLLGEMAGMILTGQRAVPKRISEQGYTFRYPRLEEALASILKRREY